MWKLTPMAGLNSAGAVCSERKPEPVHKAEEVKLPYR